MLLSNYARATGANWAVSGKSRHVGTLCLSVQVRVHIFIFRPSLGLGKAPNEKGLFNHYPWVPCSVCSLFHSIMLPHLPDHHVLGSSSYSADPILTVFPHQAVCVQVDVFSVCDQLNNNLCMSHIVADLCKKHI